MRTFHRQTTHTQGVHSDRYSGSKYTNLASFDPAYTEMQQVYDQFTKMLDTERDFPFIHTCPLHSAFIMPVTAKEVQTVLCQIPTLFLDNLKAVFLLGGTRKQEKAFHLYQYGGYWQQCIFLNAYPKSKMHLTYKKWPHPAIIEEYRRAGVHIVRKRRVMTLTFSPQSLKTFYLRDTLFHELGHHLDTRNIRQVERERFAEWFAMEYGYRLRHVHHMASY